MEQSITAVELHPQQPSEIIPPAIPPQPPASTFTKVDNNLTGIGFFTASSKRSRKEIEKTTVVVDHGIERRISIIPSAKYGLPITQDQDYWLALMKLVSEHIQREGKLVNPFTFTTADILKILGHQRHNGKNYKAVQEWLSVMKHTGIEGGAYNVAKKKWATDRVSAVDRAATVGEEFSDGTIADKNHIWFSQWQLDNINAGNLIAVELGTYIQLENNISKNLVPHLQEWLFASQHDGRFEKQYEDICQLLGIRVYRYRSQIEEKLGPSLDELVTHGYVSKWAIEPMADRKHYKLVLWHGPKYHSDRKTRLEKKPRSESLAAGEGTPSRRRPRQQRLHLAPPPEAEQQSQAVVIHYQVIAELTKRGVGQQKARDIIATVPADFPILDVLEWGDLQIAQAQGARNEIKNPPGFYIHLLEQRITPPPTFESSRARVARQGAEFAQVEAIRQAQTNQLAAEEAASAALNTQIDSLAPGDHLALLAQAKADLLARHPRPDQLEYYFQTHPEAESQDGSLRARARTLLKEGWQPPTPKEPENPHYAIKPDIRQAPTLQETGTLQPVAKSPQSAATQLQNVAPAVPTLFDLKALLSVLKLPPPAELLASMEQTIADLTPSSPVPVEQPAVKPAPAAESQPAKASTEPR